MNALQRIWLHARERTVLRYLMSGGSAAAMTFLLLYTLTSVLGFWYLGSSVVALVFGFFTSFILQKFWTFRNRSLERVRIQLPLHLLLSLSNIVLNTIFLFILVEYVGLWYLFAQFIITGLLACMNFFIYRGYIFHI